MNILYPLFSLLLLLLPIIRASTPEGNVCMTIELLKSADNTTEFYECAPLSDEEVSGYGLDSKYLGIWTLRKCPEEHNFDESKQRCVEKKTYRRQQAACANNNVGTGCVVPCQVGNTAPVIGNECNWRTATLQQDYSDQSSFLQCTPTSPSASCGEWTRLECAPSTVYNVELSVCTPVNSQNSCNNANQVAVCKCAHNNCPGASNCNNGFCCQATESLSLTNLIQHQAPSEIHLLPENNKLSVCPGSNVPPLGSCNDKCPEYSACTPDIGCCPVPVNQKPGIVKIVLCPGSYAPPLGQCGSCPQNTICNEQLQMCCPSSTNIATDLVYNVVLMCPDGTSANTPCSAGCGANSACFQGACCPISCPSGQNAVGFCNSGSCGAGNCYARTTCCQEQVKLPVCSNGQQSQKRCSVSMECGPSYECSNGGCCPIPFCPTGVQAFGRCSGSMTCGPGQSCMEGLCCPLPKCPSGIISLGVCSRSLDCGRPGVECANGGCCPLPMCPNNVIASQRCGTGTCPSGESCTNGACCPLPSCPTGGLALSICTGKCAPGFECVNNGCCALPKCPNGLGATHRCQLGVGCPVGNQCENGVCCPMPMCTSGSIASSVCGMANSCPMGYVCEGRGCCQEPMPICPNGFRASQRCSRGMECPPGYGCTPMGGCCPLSMNPVCPQMSNAVCQCSANNICPSGATCNMGTCCASASSPVMFNQVPGTTCQASSDCNGYNTNGAQCLQNTCACVNGAASNGASCEQMQTTILLLARNGCDQYGSPCKYLLSTARRKPIFAPTSNSTDTPLFYNVAAKRRCVSNVAGLDSDSTCLPNEKCINGACKLKLSPGEYGCESDEECTARCPNTYCEKRKSDKPVAQCQCKDGFLLFGRCLSQCPEGFHESGAFCMLDDEDKFWGNADAQDTLKELLNSGQC